MLKPSNYKEHLTDWVVYTRLGVNQILLNRNEQLLLVPDLKTGQLYDEIKVSSYYCVQQMKKNARYAPPTMGNTKLVVVERGETKNGMLIYDNPPPVVDSVDLDPQFQQFLTAEKTIALKNLKNGDSMFILHTEAGIKAEDFKYLCYIFDSRNLYRPKEEVTIKGWIRAHQSRDNSFSNVNGSTILTLETIANSALSIKVEDKLRNVIYESSTHKTDENGGFELKFMIPDNVNLGELSIQLKKEGVHVTNYNIRVEEFRRPEFTIESKIESSILPFIFSPSF